MESSTPTPPSDDDKKLPPRHRPSLSSLDQETTELDLWAFEDDLDMAGDLTPDALRGLTASIPSPRETRPARNREHSSQDEARADDVGDSIRMNVGRNRLQPQSAPLLQPPNPESDFEDLEQWEDARARDGLDALDDGEPAPILKPQMSAHMPVSAEVRPQEPPAPHATPVARTEDDEFTPKKPSDAAPMSMRPRLGLSRTERIGMAALLVLLCTLGLFAYLNSIRLLPSVSARANKNDFPIKGERLTVDSASSYWRAPITEGALSDTFRRGTQLLPVLVLKVGGGEGAVRVLFRNDEGEVVGDAVTRPIRGAATLDIPATAGFDDIGMHAAYRTGGSRPWTIEVFEAASENAVGRDFKRLFEINISTDRR